MIILVKIRGDNYELLILTPLSDHGIIIELGNEINTNTYSHVQIILNYLRRKPFPMDDRICTCFYNSYHLL